MEKIEKIKIQKCSDLGNDYITVELLNEEEILADIYFNKEIGEIEVSLYKCFSQKKINIKDFEKVLGDAKKIICDDMNSYFARKLKEEQS